MQEAEIGVRGVVINGEIITNIKYADDTVQLTETEKELPKFVDKIVSAGENYGMELNIKKIKVMAVTTTVTEVINIAVKGLILEQVE